jgi:hypothetical protein
MREILVQEGRCGCCEGDNDVCFCRFPKDDFEDGPTDDQIAQMEEDAQIEAAEWACPYCHSDIRGECACSDEDLSDAEKKIRGRR